jgi:ceramide glucosyltransferase
MSMLYVIFLIIGLLVFFVSWIPIGLFVLLYSKNKTEPQLRTPFSVAVIVPCKGLGTNLEKNLRALCEQDYPTYQVLFVLDSPQDPAYPLINTIVHSFPNTRIEYAEKIPEASGKIAALISGIKAAGSVDVYVFADSDIKPHTQWLTHLVAGLSDEKVGATTGFRWFFPINLKTALISTWNMAGMTSLYHPLSNFAWGGSTAIKKTVFDSLQIESKWRMGFSDDLILTAVVKKAGYRIQFVPSCVSESPVETEIRKFLDWGTGQFTWVRWYSPIIWILSFIGMGIFQFLILFGFILLFTGFTIPGLLLISPLILETIFGFIGFRVLRNLMRYPKEKFGSAAPYAFFMPIVNILFSYNMLLSSVKQKIKWGGKYYSKRDTLRRM